jgi:hypothetical protein
MANKDFKVKNKLQVGGITTSGPVVSDAYGNLDSTSSIATQFGGTGTTTSPTSGQILYSAAGTTYAPATLAGLPGTYAVGNTASRPGSPSLGQIYSNTETGYIEVYTSAGWSQLGVIPESATIGTATDVGTNRPYNNGAISVSFTPSAGGGLVSRFTATSTTGGYSAFASSSPIVVPDIPVGTSATFTVTATNGYGNALPTTASNSATTTTVPQAPTIGTPTNVTGAAFGSTVSASVPVTANATGGKTISGFTVTSSPGSLTATGTSPVTVTGLTSGTSYTFTAVANNANGSSTATSASSSLTPSTVPQTPTIGTVSVTNNTTVSVPFTAGQNGNSSITSYIVTASPSVGNISTSGTTSPLTVTGTFASNTSYTFVLKAVNANGESQNSSSSNSIIPAPAYVLTGTYNSSATHTFSNNTTKFAAYLIGGGLAGQAGSGNGGAGGQGSGAAAFQEASVSAGSNATVTIGGAQGGVSSIRLSGSNVDIATASTAGGASNVSGAILSPGAIGRGNGGNLTAYSDSYPGGMGNAGNAGSDGPILTLNAAGLGSVQWGGGGGGGGAGGQNQNYSNSGSRGSLGGGAAGSPHGGGGAGGGSVGGSTPPGFTNAGSGGAANGPGGGGGGGGGRSFGAAQVTNNSANGNGGAGAQGRILIYEL